VANIDKQSVRSEVDKVKSEFESLCAAGKVPDETRVLMRSLLMIMELILSIFMERKTRKDSSNSSLPPSQTPKDESALDADSPGSHNKGKPCQPATVGNFRRVETVSISEVLFCDHCGEDLQAVDAHAHERRTKIDILFEKVVDHVDAQIKTCPACQEVTKGSFPADRPGPLQYGDGLKAFAINLLVCQMVSINRVQKLLKSMMGELLSEATLLKFVLRLHQALEDWEQSAIEQIITQPALHVDETSFQVDRRKYWIHVYSSGRLTLKFLHRKRGKEAIRDIGIIPRYGGVTIHDCWASYLSYDHCGHGLCGSHLLRELTFVVDSNGYVWARHMKQLLQKTCKQVSGQKDKKLDEKGYANLQKRYRTIITQGEKELPPIPPKPSGKKGKIAKSDAHNLWERLEKHEAAVLRFAKDSHVAFTNNRAEQDLRMAKVKQKVSGCFRTVVYAHAYCRISSYLQTMANQGVNPLIAIQMALAGNAGGE